MPYGSSGGLRPWPEIAMQPLSGCRRLPHGHGSEASERAPVLLRGPATAKVTWDGCSTLEVDPAGGGSAPSWVGPVADPGRAPDPRWPGYLRARGARSS